jgi:hypothetical protein
MFRLDYLSCFLTVVATILVGRRMWTGLVVSCVNSLIVCVIGLHTAQYGFIPANVFCICINAFSLRSWLKSDSDSSVAEAGKELVAGYRRVSGSIQLAARRYRPVEKRVPIEGTDFAHAHLGWMDANRHAYANVVARVGER